MKCLTALFIVILTVTALKAEVQPSSMFDSGMVLQREMLVPVWGRATPGEKVTVGFAGQTKSTMALKDGKAPAQFWLAGKDQEWMKATATIKDQTVVVSAEGLAAPVAVRYAFAAFPKVNLVNGAGLPAYPFRSDTWKRVGYKK